MSRIGKQPVVIPDAVTLTHEGQVVTVKGAKGELSFTLPESVQGKLEDGAFTVTPVRENDKVAKSMWGMCRTMISNLIVGVTDGTVSSLNFVVLVTGRK